MFTSARKMDLVWLMGIVLALLISVAVPGLSAAQSVAERIQETGVLRVAFEGTYPPFNYVNDNGELTGFDVDISREIAHRLGVEPVFFPTPWTNLIQELEDDHFDVIIAQMSITEERQRAVDFTIPYVISGTVLVAREEDDRFNQLSDIAGHTVGVAEGTTFESVARSVNGADVRLYDDFQSYTRELISGNVDVIVEDQLTAAYAIKEQGLPLKITSPVFTEEHISIAVKKGNQDFVDDLNRVINEMKADGTYRAIFMSWFGEEPLLQGR